MERSENKEFDSETEMGEREKVKTWRVEWEKANVKSLLVGWSGAKKNLAAGWR